MYLRVSSTGQIKRDHDPEGISIPAQRVACQRKAEQLGLTVVGEYVEPGQSAQEMDKRVAFHQMLTRARAADDVDVILVYKLSRMARNRIDDALVMADLRQRGITLISATEAIDDSPVGQLMHGILATVNEYQSHESGADIAYKMSQKARNGGTIGRARLGYLNHIDRSGGRDIRTVIIDPERGPMVQLGFELFATSNYTLAELAHVLYNHGLRTRPTARYPTQRVSISKLAHMRATATTSATSPTKVNGSRDATNPSSTKISSTASSSSASHGPRTRRPRIRLGTPANGDWPELACRLPDRQGGDGKLDGKQAKKPIDTSSIDDPRIEAVLCE